MTFLILAIVAIIAIYIGLRIVKGIIGTIIAIVCTCVLFGGFATMNPLSFLTQQGPSDIGNSVVDTGTSLAGRFKDIITGQSTPQEAPEPAPQPAPQPSDTSPEPAKGLFGAVDKVKKSIYSAKETFDSHKIANHFVPHLTGQEKSSTSEGAAKFGATIVLGDLDQLGRSTFSHILVKDSQEPGTHGIKRNERINVNPAGWANYKINGYWANNRLHLVGYQFSGLNDELRNLVTGTAMLNKGTEGNGTDQSNPKGMLYYEQRLDSWLANHPHYALDYYVKPIYEGDGKVVKHIYMQWVGIDQKGQTIPIRIGGKSKRVKYDYEGVVLDNVSPSLKIDYETGQIVRK